MGIKDEIFLFTEVLKGFPSYDLQDHYFTLKLLKLIYINLFFILIFIRGLLVFISTRNHLLTTLFSLEYLVLLLFLLFFTYLLSYGFELYFILIFLVFSVCEGSLGLGILVNIVRRHGNDYLSSINILRW